MSDKLVFLPEARQDVAEAYSWYEGQASGLGMDFIRCLEVAILSIERYIRSFMRIIVARSSGVFLTPYFLSMIVAKLQSIPYSIAPKIPGNGATDSWNKPNKRMEHYAATAARLMRNVETVEKQKGMS